MRLSEFFTTFALFVIAKGAPTLTSPDEAEIVERATKATITDIAISGYATQNGGLVSFTPLLIGRN